jgi:hypothetical protein
MGVNADDTAGAAAGSGGDSDRFDWSVADGDF